MKKIAILGSTGSIGTQTLEIVRNQPTSSPLLTRDAESIVTFFPIDQFGCFSASSIVIAPSSSFFLPRNARWLFDVPLEQIQVVIHPQSIIHSAVEYVDGGIMAQLGMPDMKLPIQYALFYSDASAHLLSSLHPVLLFFSRGTARPKLSG